MKRSQTSAESGNVPGTPHDESVQRIGWRRAGDVVCGNTRNLIGLAAVSVLAMGAAGGWFAATLRDVAENPAILWAGSALIVLFVAGALYAIHRFMRAFLLDVRALAEAGRLLLGPNPERRGVPCGHPDVADLATVFNSLADRYYVGLGCAHDWRPLPTSPAICAAMSSPCRT